MRILHFTATYLPTVNGVSFQISLLKKWFKEKGHDIRVMAPYVPGFTINDPDVWHYPSLPNPFSHNYPIGIPLYSFSKIKDFNPQIIHTHHPFVFGRYASHLSNKLFIPLLFTAHTYYELYLKNYLKLRRLHHLANQLIIRDIKGLAQKCNFVICPSAKCAVRLNSYGIHNTIMIHNGIELDIFKPTLLQKKTTPSIVFVGRLEEEKNPCFLLQVARYLHLSDFRFQLKIVGAGSLFKKMQVLTNAYRLGHKVTFLGEVPRISLPNIFSGSHLFITASKSEIMPISILEALACGLPVLAPKSANIDEIVVDGKTGFGVPLLPSEYGKKITQLFDNQRELGILSKNAVLHVRKFSIEKTAKQIETLYSSSIYHKSPNVLQE